MKTAWTAVWNTVVAVMVPALQMAYFEMVPHPSRPRDCVPRPSPGAAS